MENYRCLMVAAGPVKEVYDALTTPAGLQGWWTTTCDVDVHVGTLSIFRFGQTYNVMEIEKLVPNAQVCWRCVEQYYHAPDKLSRDDEWVGTKLRFRLTSPKPGVTLLDFEHFGLTPKLECYAICERGWDHFLKKSLKLYIETGKGEPFVPVA